MTDTNFSDLHGKVIVEIIGAKEGNDEIIFHCSDGSVYKMYHYQDCCEQVAVKQIDGDIEDLLNSEILMAEESSNNEAEEFCTWTFYKLATMKGYVTIQWLGESNGYYSEEVSFVKID
jgi:hypothetical protein